MPSILLGHRDAQTVLDKVVAAGVQSDRGVKTGNFTVLTANNRPAQLLEMGFVSNTEDNRLFDAKFQEYSKAIADGILTALGISCSSVTVPPVPPTPPTQNAVVRDIQLCPWTRHTGGHVDAGEFGMPSAVRELEEELGIKVNLCDIRYICTIRSDNKHGKIWDRHFNEVFLVFKDLDIDSIKLQDNEVEEIKWIDYDKYKKMIFSRDKSLTTKWESHDSLVKYFDRYGNDKASKKTVSICGSMKFADVQKRVAEELELKNGWCVLQCIYGDGKLNYTPQDEVMLDVLHKQKIDLSDAIYVVNVGGYIGKSTRSEIEYARQCGKEIIYHEKI